MPRRELSRPQQVTEWLQEWGGVLKAPALMTLIGSAAWLCYDAIIGSEFEQTHGWHINLMPESVLKELPDGWRERVSLGSYGHLGVMVPHPADLLAPKLRRNEPRDRQHAAWAHEQGLI